MKKFQVELQILHIGEIIISQHNLKSCKCYHRLADMFMFLEHVIARTCFCYVLTLFIGNHSTF